MGARAFDRADAGRQADSARDLGGVVPLVPRDGRNHVLRSRGDRDDQSALRSGARRQRSPARRQRALQHGRLADDGVFGARRDDPHRCDLPAAARRCGARSTRSPTSIATTNTKSPSASRQPRTERAAASAAPREDIDLMPLRSRSWSRTIRAGVRPKYGGFGNEPKFPQPEVHRVSARRMAPRGGQDLHDMAARTLLAMARGGTYDHVEGGFFRYSTTRDWSVPHFEKMAEDHAGLHPRARRPRTLCAERTVARRRSCRRSDTFGRCCAIPKPDSLPAAKTPTKSTTSCRSTSGASSDAPYVDRTSYTNWTCALAGSLCWAARALDDDVLLAEALANARRRRTRDCWATDGCSITSSCRTARRRCAACSPITSLTRVRCSTRTRFRASRAFSTGLAPSSKPFFANFASRKRAGSTTGLRATKLRAARRCRPADRRQRRSLPKRFCGWPRSSARARIANARRKFCGVYRRTAAASGPFAATYARALRRFLTPELTVKIVGDPAQTDAFREAALRLPAPVGAVRTLSPRDASDAQLPADPQPAAYVCTASACGAPVRDAAELRAALDAYKVQPVPTTPQAGTDRIND